MDALDAKLSCCLASHIFGGVAPFFHHSVKEIGDGIGKLGDALQVTVNVAERGCSFHELRGADAFGVVIVGGKEGAEARTMDTGLGLGCALLMGMGSLR